MSLALIVRRRLALARAAARVTQSSTLLESALTASPLNRIFFFFANCFTFDWTIRICAICFSSSKMKPTKKQPNPRNRPEYSVPAAALSRIFNRKRPGNGF